MIKVSETIVGSGSKIKVKIEKLRTNNSTYKTLSFIIKIDNKEVYRKSDITQL